VASGKRNASVLDKRRLAEREVVIERQGIVVSGSSLSGEMLVGPPAHGDATAAPFGVPVRYSRKHPRLWSTATDAKQIDGFHLQIEVIIWLVSVAKPGSASSPPEMSYNRGCSIGSVWEIKKGSREAGRISLIPKAATDSR